MVKWNDVLRSKIICWLNKNDITIILFLSLVHRINAYIESVFYLYFSLLWRNRSVKRQNLHKHRIGWGFFFNRAKTCICTAWACFVANFLLLLLLLSTRSFSVGIVKPHTCYIIWLWFRVLFSMPALHACMCRLTRHLTFLI